MYDVHKFMALDAYEVQYFIQQVALAAQSLGVQKPDVEEVGNALQKYFGSKCAPPEHILPKSSKQLQAICIAVSSNLREIPLGRVVLADVYPRATVLRRQERARRRATRTQRWSSPRMQRRMNLLLARTRLQVGNRQRVWLHSWVFLCVRCWSYLRHSLLSLGEGFDELQV